MEERARNDGLTVALLDRRLANPDGYLQVTSRDDVSMGTDGRRRNWERDAALLSEVGRLLLVQEPRVTVRLPRGVAQQVLAAWQRDDDEGDIQTESPPERRTRTRAGTLALIGLSVEQNGRLEGEEVVVDLAAWHVGLALEAADDADPLD